MNTKFIKKGIALLTMTMICSMATARPHHHFRHAPKRVTTVVVVKEKNPIDVKKKIAVKKKAPKVVKKVIIVR